MKSADIARLQRLAKNLPPECTEILDLLAAPAGTDKLVLAAELGMPPVMVVLDIVPAALAAVLKQDSVRRFVGTAIAAALADRKWVVDRTGVRVPDATSPFSTGAIYKPAPVTAAAATDNELLNAMIGGLSATQRGALIARLQTL